MHFARYPGSIGRAEAMINLLSLAIEKMAGVVNSYKREEAVGISPSSVGRIWADAGLKPHLTKGFNPHSPSNLQISLS